MSAPFDVLDAERRRLRNEAAGGNRRHIADEDPVAWRSARWATALLLLLSLGATLTALVLFQATSEGASRRSLRRAVAALSEVDVLIDRNYDALRTEASNGARGDTFHLADFPVNVPLTRDEVLTSSKVQLRGLLLDRSASIMYSDGTSSLRTTPGAVIGVGPFTAGGVTDRGLGFLTQSHHDILRVITLALAGVSGLLCIALAALCRGFARLASVGAVVLAAALPLLAAGAGMRAYIHFTSRSQTEYLQREFLAIGRGLAVIPIRDGSAMAALGAVTLAIGGCCAVWADRTAALRPDA